MLIKGKQQMPADKSVKFQYLESNKTLSIYKQAGRYE